MFDEQGHRKSRLYDPGIKNHYFEFFIRPVQNDFWAILKNCNLCIFFIFCKNLQKSHKSEVSDTNGPQKHAYREENMLIDPGEVDF